MKIKNYQIGIIGSAGSDDYNGATGATVSMMRIAEDIGRLLAMRGAIVVTGGKSGIMEAAAKGAQKAGGITIGVIKGGQRFKSNTYTDIEVISGMEIDGLDELLLVNMCDGLIAIGGGAGTLQEIAIAYRNKKPVIALNCEVGWAKKVADCYLDDRKRIFIESASSAEKAVSKMLTALDVLYE
ncbi:MAG: LOG family protein [Patescibacteria group bacterium]